MRAPRCSFALLSFLAWAPVLGVSVAATEVVAEDQLDGAVRHAGCDGPELEAGPSDVEGNKRKKKKGGEEDEEDLVPS